MSKIIQITLVVFFLYGCTTTTTPTTKVTTAKVTTAKATTKLTTTPKTQKKYSDNEGIFFQIEKYKSIEDYLNDCLVLNKIENTIVFRLI
jgi:PBP1b-binding outer membrane lipoprotein LpoB